MRPIRVFYIIISTHSPRVGRTDRFPVHRSGMPDFNSLAPCGANLQAAMLRLNMTDFNSLAPCGANHRHLTVILTFAPFQLTRPVWGEPLISLGRRTSRTTFQLTRPVWGEPPLPIQSPRCSRISTHSPRVGRTVMPPTNITLTAISTHSPRVGRTSCAVRRRIPPIKFQLTRPVWGEPI